jgi:hypothetical protein
MKFQHHCCHWESHMLHFNWQFHAKPLLTKQAHKWTTKIKALGTNFKIIWKIIIKTKLLLCVEAKVYKFKTKEAKCYNQQGLEKKHIYMRKEKRWRSSQNQDKTWRLCYSCTCFQDKHLPKKELAMALWKLNQSSKGNATFPSQLFLWGMRFSHPLNLQKFLGPLVI